MKAVLLLGYGSPDTPEDVREYYANIVGRPVREEAVRELMRKYEVIGMSPFNRIVWNIASKLENSLNGDYKVFVGMKNWKPYIVDAIRELIEFDDIIAIALTPFYSKFHTERYFSELQKSPIGNSKKIKIIKEWFDSPLLKNAWINVIRESRCSIKNVVFTAHSLPEAKDDPYKDQIEYLVKEIARDMGINNWQLAFQSRPMNVRGKWLGPGVGDVVHDFQCGYGVTIVPIGFVHDSLEVLYDLDHELPEKFPECSFCRVDTLNDREDFIKVLVDLVKG